MYYMNSMIIVENGNGCISTFLPNEIYAGKILLPRDGNDDMDFDLVFNTTELIAARFGLIDRDMNTLKKLKVPSNIRIWKGNGEYSLFSENMQIGHFVMPIDIVSSKVITGIAILLEKRWRIARKQATMLNKVNKGLPYNR